MTYSSSETEKTIRSVEKRIEVTAEFERALERLDRTRDNLFITGKAGTGKSTLLRLFRRSTQKRLAVVAPTGIAAINVEGQTIHSFFRFPLHFIEPEHVRKAGRNQRIMENLDVLVIDEVSMVRADLMDAIDLSLRLNRGRPSDPFGGVQVVLFGDMFQLPPVVGEELEAAFQRKYESPYFFSAQAFGQSRLHLIELSKVFRQSSDPDFLGLLSRIRRAEWTLQDIETLNERVCIDVPSEAAGQIILTTTNHDARRLNETRLAALRGPAFDFEAAVTGKFEESSFPTEQVLSLKKGAQVMLVKNDPAKRWVNGDLAVVSSVSDDGVRINLKGTDLEVERVRWGKYQYGFDERRDKITQKSIGTFEQYPLKLAWAITIHKSQGQTFEDVMIEWGRGAFAHGQAYVALSRCTTLNGLRLQRPVRPEDIIFDPRILKYMKTPVRRNCDGED